MRKISGSTSGSWKINRRNKHEKQSTDETLIALEANLKSAASSFFNTKHSQSHPNIGALMDASKLPQITFNGNEKENQVNCSNKLEVML